MNRNSSHTRILRRLPLGSQDNHFEGRQEYTNRFVSGEITIQLCSPSVVTRSERACEQVADHFDPSELEPPCAVFPKNPSSIVMSASRGVKRKRGSAKPPEVKVSTFIGSPDLAQDCSSLRTSTSRKTRAPTFQCEKRAFSTFRRKHHSLQEFKSLAKHAKLNETRIIVKQHKPLRSSPDRAWSAKTDPT